MTREPDHQTGPGSRAAGGQGAPRTSTGVVVGMSFDPSDLSRCDTSFGLSSDTDGGAARDDTASTHEDPLRGVTLGDVVIESLIAEGGMGRVYRGQQQHPPRPVAVKLMRQGRSRVMAERFRREVELLGRLVHPNIAQIFIAGECLIGLERVPYFVMEFLPDAEPLVRFATRKQLTTLQRVELFLQACDAVAEGHRQGIVHRDLKPGNLLVSCGGRATDTSDSSTIDEASETPPRVKVIDFGIAKAITPGDEAQGFTETGEFLGTRQYMSPEQFSGQPGVAIDARSDVYSLGIVLQQLVSGGLPYEVAGRSLLETARIVQEQSPKPLSVSEPRVAPRIRQGLRRIVSRCLEKSPECRYPDATALASDLRRLLAGEEIAAAGSLRRLAAVVRTRPVVTASVIAVLGLVLAAVAGRLGSRPATVVASSTASARAAIARPRGGFATSVSGSRTEPLEWVILQFENDLAEPLRPEWFSLTRDGLPVDVSGIELEDAGGRDHTWFLRGLRPLNSKQGKYVLTLADKALRDVNGHAFELERHIAWSMPPFASFQLRLDDDTWRDHVVSMDGVEPYTEQHAKVPATFVRPQEPGREGTVVLRFQVDFAIHAALLDTSPLVWTTGDPFPYDPGAWALMDVSRDGEVWENVITLGPNQRNDGRPPWNILHLVEGSREVWVRARLTGTKEWPDDGLIFSQFLRTSSADNGPALQLDLTGPHAPVIPVGNDSDAGTPEPAEDNPAT